MKNTVQMCWVREQEGEDVEGEGEGEGQEAAVQSLWEWVSVHKVHV